jgi:flagellin
VMDTDYAAESAAVAKGQVLQQAGAAVLAQANASTNYVLVLLR